MKTIIISPPLKQIAEELKKIIDDPQARNRILGDAAIKLRIVLETQDRAAGYPPDDPRWNSPPGSRGDNVWYQRQFGTRWINKNGLLGGTNESEKLQKNWRSDVQQIDNFTASAYTEVTYAPKLYDPVNRAPWAALHGWPTVDEIAAGYQPRFVELVLAEIDKQIGKL
jgi:hypothetical protein